MTIEELRTEAHALRKEKGADCISLRSCWHCNNSHEHLKDRTGVVLCCIVCGCVFYKGRHICTSHDATGGEVALDHAGIEELEWKERS